MAMKPGDSVREELVQIGDATNWITVAGGDRMMVALKADGSLWKWEWERTVGSLSSEGPSGAPTNAFGHP